MCVGEGGGGANVLLLSVSLLEESQPFGERNWKRRVKMNLSFVICALGFSTSLPIHVMFDYNLFWKIAG